MGATRQGSDIISGWPEESREAAQLGIDTYGEPHEATDSLLTWHEVGPWKRVLAAGTNTADPDQRVLSDEDLERAAQEGK